MPVKDILLYPSPFLRKVCKEVTSFDHGLKTTIMDLKDTLHVSPGVGLSAPQIGSDIRVIVVDTSKERLSPIVLINPVILSLEDIEVVREGCLSIPQYTANVKRAKRVKVRGLDESGHDITLSSQGLEAIALQHEIDHLDGILFIDRIASLKSDLFRRKGYKGRIQDIEGLIETER